MRRFLLFCLFPCFLRFPLGAQEPIRVQIGIPVPLNPLFISTAAQTEVFSLLYDRLIALDAEGRYVPQILEKWTFSPDHREVALKIRPGLRWHDGRPLDADDILFTWRLLRTPKVRALAGNQASGIPSLEKVDALTLRIRLARPRATLLAELHDFIPVPRAYPPLSEPKIHFYNRLPVGSGPFRVSRESTPDRLVLDRWEGYKGPHPGAWPKMVFFLNPNPKGVEAVEKGAIDFMESASWLTYYLVRTGARGFQNVVPLQDEEAGFRAIWFNCDPQKSLMSDVRLRRALAELYPWDAISKVRSVWPVSVAGCIWPSSSWAHDATPRPLPRRQLAESCLDEAGWRRGPDGWRRNGEGRVLRLEFIRYLIRGETFDDPILTGFLAAAKECGIQIEDHLVPFAKASEAWGKGEGDLWLMNWLNAGPDPNGDSALFTTSGIPGGANFTRYSNPLVDQLFEDGVHAIDLEQRALIYRRINQILMQDRPLLLLDYLLYYGFHHRRLKGVAYRRQGGVFEFVPGMRGWTLER